MSLRDQFLRIEQSLRVDGVGAAVFKHPGCRIPTTPLVKNPTSIETEMRWRCHLICLALVIVTWIVFFQVRDFDFVNYDDGAYVFDNQFVLSGFTGDSLRWLMNRDGTTGTGSWLPLTWLSLMLDGHLFGKDAGAFHLTSAILHTANVLLLFTVLKQMTGDIWKSAFVAALFGVHPLHVESVAWISARKDVLSTFFGLISLWAYARFATQHAKRWYLLALVAFVLSLCSKQMLVTLPLLCFLLDYWPLGRWSQLSEASAESADKQIGRESTRSEPRAPHGNNRRLIYEKLPFILLAMVFCVIALWSQQKGGSMVSLDQSPFSRRASNAVVVCVIYIIKTVWPAHLAVFYPYPPTLPFLYVVGSAILLLVITVLAVAYARQHAYCLVGWLWYLGTLVPVIGLVQVGSQRMADRYTYIPTIGLFVVATWLIPALIPFGLMRKTLLPCMGVLALSVLTVVAWRQTGYWQNSNTLFTHAASVTEHNYFAHYNLADLRYEEGRIKESILHFREFLNVQMENPEAHSDYGLLLSTVGRLDEARHHFDVAADINNHLGETLLSQGQRAAAIRHFREALRLKPYSPRARANLQRALAEEEHL